MKKCSKCGNDIADNAQFCAKCGSQQPAAEAATSASAPTGNEPIQEGTGISKEEYRDAKVAYKQARKAAGKSRKPLIVVIILAILVVAGGAAGGTWYFMSQQNASSQIQAPEKETSGEKTTTEEKSTEEKPESTATATVISDPYAAYVGTWKGEMTATEPLAGNKRCYGAEENELTLEIESISSTGRVKASGELLYHGHKGSLASDADKTAGDEVIKFSNLTSTFSNSGFDFVISVNESKRSDVTMKVTPQNSNGTSLQVVVSAKFEGSSVERDTYILTKVD